MLRGKNIALGLAALCLTCTTLLLQFASTVLLSDLKLRTITGAGQTAMMPYGIKNGDNGNDETEPLETRLIIGLQNLVDIRLSLNILSQPQPSKMAYTTLECPFAPFCPSILKQIAID